MGDRVLYQVVSKDRREFSPVVYCHWSGRHWQSVVELLKQQMGDRRNNVDYAAARLVEIAAKFEGSGHSIGLGIWNAVNILTSEDSHGDRGIVLIDADTFEVERFGHYDGVTYPSLSGYVKSKAECSLTK